MYFPARLPLAQLRSERVVAGLTIWGKLGGGGLGFALGGPLGALLGAVAGHFLVDREGALLGPAPPDVIVTTGLIALSAKMAVADGVVVPSELEAFERIMVIPEAEKPRVKRLFEIAQATTDGFEAYAGQVARALEGEPALLEDVLDGLFIVARADGAYHDRELAYLRRVATIFGYDEDGFNRILTRHAYVRDDPYRVLGLDEASDDETLKRRYRELVASTHPDREIARGLPPEAIRIATERLAAINAAWDVIRRRRGI